MAIAPTQKPDDNAGGGNVAGTDPRNAYSGTRTPSDSTTEPGQYPPGSWGTAFFGGTLPTGTGAPGTQGARHGSGTDATNEPGQNDDGFTGLPESDLVNSGAPGTSTTPNTTGGADTISYTNPGAYLAGTQQSETVQDDISGPRGSTMANDEGYGTSGPKLPGMMEPVAGTGAFQPQSGGKVLRGGRAVRG